MMTLQEVVSLAEAGQLSRANVNAKKGLKSAPNDPNWLNAAGVIAHRRGKLKEAEGYFRKSIVAGAQIPSPFRALVGLYNENGRFSEALNVWDRAKPHAWRDAELGVSVAFAMYQKGEIDRVQDILNRYVSHIKDNSEAWNLLGVAQAGDGDYAAAIESYNHSLRLKPSPDTHANLAYPYRKIGQIERAFQHLDQALAMDEKHINALERKAIFQSEQGDYADAIEAFELICTLDPTYGNARYHLAKLLPEDALPAFYEDTSIELSRLGKSDPNLPFFTLTRSIILGRLGRQSEANKTLALANVQFAKHRKFRPGEEHRKGEAVRMLWSSRAWSEILEKGASDVAPIFILGTMRSGTTLLERMMSNHSALKGLGEVGLIDRFFRKSDGDLEPEDFENLRREYETHACIEAVRTVDKMPINMRYAGFLHALWPSARLIHIQRNPNDVALSIFEAFFDSQAQNFSFTEAGITEYFEEHQRQVAFWNEQGIPMKTVRYEDLVRDPAAILSEVSRYCEIDMEIEMLAPERNEAPIQTASLLQARKPINTASVNRWTTRADLLPTLFARWENDWEAS